MDLKDCICLAGVVITIICGAYVIFRANWVCNWRIRFINDKTVDWDELKKRYYALPTYDEMVWQLFTWNWKARP